MGDSINLSLEARTIRGKKVARLRSEGFVPAVVYGHGVEPQLLQAPYGSVEKAVRDAGRHSPVHITVGSKKHITLVKDISRDPVKATIQHISLHAVKARDAVTAEVPIRLVGEGESEAEKAGLVVLQAIETIEIKAKPADLPEAIEVSIVRLATTDDKLTLEQLELPRGVNFADSEQDTSLVVANVYEPAALQAANDAAGGDEEESDAGEVLAENGDETTDQK